LSRNGTPAGSLERPLASFGAFAHLRRVTPRYPKPRILAQLPSTGHVVIEASAGTGKTYTLEHLLIELLLTTDARIDEILVVTFTEKATGELKQRIRAKLEELITRTSHDDAEPAWVLDAEAKRRLSNALFALDSATIATIHSFCQRVLTENAFANGRLFSQTQADGEEIFADAFKECLRQEFARDPAHREYLRLWLESGQSVAKLQALLHDCIRERSPLRPEFEPARLRIALQPFTTQLANQVQAELKAAKVHASTVKAVVERLNSFGTLAESSGSMSDAELTWETAGWADGGDKSKIAYVLKALSSDKAQAAASAGTVIAFLEELLEALVPFSSAIAQRFLPVVRARVDRRKRELGLFDFDDMLTLVRDSLHGPRGDDLCATLRQRYRFALIDEFQDTDEVQWDIFRRVFFESSGPHRLFLVGDPKQAIYRFRGADVETYLRAKELVGNCVALTENFRSTRDVIDAYNRVFLPQGAVPYFTGDGHYEAIACGDKSLRAESVDGQPIAPVHLFHFAGTKAAMSAEQIRSRLHQEIAREIRRLVDPATAFSFQKGDKRASPTYRDIYCLTFSASEGLALGRVLREAGIPIAYFKQEGLFQQPEAAHIRDLLIAVDDPQNRQKRFRAWLTPFFGLTLTDLAEARDVEGTNPLIERLADWHELATDRQYTRLFSRIMQESGLVRREIFWGDSERALTNYQHLFEILLEEAHRTRCTLGDLILKLRAWIDDRESPDGSGNVQRVEGDRDAVQIMTMHKSKGLEAQVVFIAGGLRDTKLPKTLRICHDRTRQRLAYFTPILNPAVKQRVDAEETQETERLLYVALTRAKARLYLPYFGEVSEAERQQWAPEAELGSFSVDGVYEPAHAALRLLLRSSDPEIPRLFERELVNLNQPAPLDEVTPSTGEWSPPTELLAEASSETDHARLREERRGFMMTSYSQLSQAHAALTDAEPDEFTDEAVAPKTLPLGENELPPGALIGVYLHELLELLPLELTRDATDVKAWSALPEIRSILETSAERHGIDAKQSALAEPICFTALRTPVALPNGATLPSFCHVDRMLREMEFLYPIPEDVHPRLGEAAEGKAWSIERGFIKGFIDLIFEYQGRAYFADWKSDRLASFDDAAIREHVEGHYEIQEKLYSLALVKLLDIRTEAEFEARFGGLLYLFLRGMKIDERGQAGIYTWRPTWADLLRWEEELRNNETWTLRPQRAA
jgi:exodeoxyribonuclease V beta subunit